MGAMANSSTASYVKYEEVVVANDKGLREVHYYLKRRGGGSDLVLVGKEGSLKNMSYHHNHKSLLLSNLNRASLPKLRSRREVTDWLNTLISGLDQDPICTRRLFGSDTDNVIEKFGAGTAAFMWLGSPWTCQKRRTHYQSFCRNGFILSVHDFVYVLAEENKRLVAYLDDVYEDCRGNKMAVVRWFHKIDEVRFVLPGSIYNDGEIFFSLCLQHLSIECIDGLATVLSPDHYKKLISEATRAGLAPFVCCRQFDNDDVKPFDITSVKGYWRQGILRNTSSDANVSVKRSIGDAVGCCRPNKRIRWSKESARYLKPKTVSIKTNLKEDVESFQTCLQYLAIGSQVEILSQDSGIRGCWFRALIIKKHKDKVKVKYQDIKDVADDSKNLEEWVLATRIAAPDVLGIRVPGRTIVRPTPSHDEGVVPFAVNVGSIVDAWWHDGWWEGIVVRKESDDRLHVHFSGEKQEQIFTQGGLRRSQEWFENGWRSIGERQELSSKLSSGLGKLIKTEKSADNHKDVALSGGPEQADLPQKVVQVGLIKNEKVTKEEESIRDLSKDGMLAQLKWKASGKRRRPRSPVHNNSTTSDFSGMKTCERFFVDSNLKFRTDKWKYGDGFNSSMVSPLANLVMSS